MSEHVYADDEKDRIIQTYSKKYATIKKESDKCKLQIQKSKMQVNRQTKPEYWSSNNNCLG